MEKDKSHCGKNTLVCLIDKLIEINNGNEEVFIDSFEDDYYKDLKREINKLIERMAIKIEESKKTNENLAGIVKELQQAYYIIQKSSIVLFEWTLKEEIPTKYVSENISIFGYDREDFYNGKLKDYWDFVYFEDRIKTKKAVYESRKRESDELVHKYRVVCKNGDIRWVEEWMIHEKDDSGILVSEKGVLRDITEQMSMAEKLKISENRYKKLFENTSALVFSFDLLGNIIEKNKAFTDIFGDIKKNFFDIDLYLTTKGFEGKKMNTLELINYIEKSPGRILEYSLQGEDGKNYVIEIRFSIRYEGDKSIEIQGIGQDISYRKEAEKKLKYISEHDKLSGLYNREYFDRKMEELNRNNEFPFSIVVGDMNGLKITNDAFGHSKGDELIFNIGRILKRAAGTSDIVCRLGGDEFAVIMRRSDEKRAEEFCKSVKKMCEESKISPIKPSIALGSATKNYRESEISEIFKEADDKMYRNKISEMGKTRDELIKSLRLSLSDKKYESVEHSDRIKKLSLLIGKRLKLNDLKLQEISLTAEMHDIGKISIPDNILLKEEKLTSHEWEVIKKHSQNGYHILLSSPNLAHVAENVLYHHERWDGRGYPKGISRYDIPIVARIISVADCYESMTQDRPYRKKMDKDKAIEEIISLSGKKYDPRIVDTFADILR